MAIGGKEDYLNQLTLTTRGASTENVLQDQINLPQTIYLITLYGNKGQLLIILNEHRPNLDSSAAHKAHCQSEELIKMLIISIDPPPLIVYTPNQC